MSQVTLYVDCNFSGRNASYGVGSYHWIPDAGPGLPNDSISSIIVPNGLSIDIYQDGDYGGAKLTFQGPANISCLTAYNIDWRHTWNDQLSSFKVYYSTPPVDCVGQWNNLGGCTAACGQAGNYQQQQYQITTQPQGSGAACPAADRATRSVWCSGPTCPKVDCVGGWSNVGSCTATCGQTGNYQQQKYTITTKAQNGGTGCPFGDGATQWVVCSGGTCPPPPCSTVNLTGSGTMQTLDAQYPYVYLGGTKQPAQTNICTPNDCQNICLNSALCSYTTFDNNTKTCTPYQTIETDKNNYRSPGAYFVSSVKLN
jgi:hypothetical protein